MGKYLYLLNVTFYAGSDEPEDTDKALFLLSVDEEISEIEMENIFKEVNELLDTYNENSNFPISYEQGLNIDTLIEGVEIYTKGNCLAFYSNYGVLDGINNYYEIEQWQ